MKKLIILMVFGFFLNMFPINVSAVYIDPSTEFWISSNENYTSIGLDFYKIDILDSYIGFNNTYFNNTASSDFLFNISYLDENIASLLVDETALRFNVTGNGNVNYSIDGFVPGNFYNISGHIAATEGINASANGSLGFNSAGNSYEVVIKRGVQVNGPSGSNNDEWGTTLHSAVTPVNNTENLSTSFQFTVDINEQDGIDGFNYTIECNNSQTISGNGVTNGTKILSLFNLVNNCTYTIWVNSSNFDGSNFTRSWYNFTTRASSGSIEGAEIFIIISFMIVLFVMMDVRR